MEYEGRVLYIKKLHDSIRLAELFNDMINDIGLLRAKVSADFFNDAEIDNWLKKCQERLNTKFEELAENKEE